MKFKKLKQNILRGLGNIFLHSVINVLCKSVKIEKHNFSEVEKLIAKRQNFVLAFWHGKMLIPWYLHRSSNFAALVSQSKDGELLTNSLEKWGYNIARGSSHKGGKEALETLLELARQNYSIAITPDGPTGPAKVMKAGAVITAQRSGIPLVLCGVSIKKKYVLKSWDKFEIPKFFSKVTVKYSIPVFIKKELNRDEVSAKIRKLNEELIQLGKDAEETL